MQAAVCLFILHTFSHSPMYMPTYTHCTHTPGHTTHLLHLHTDFWHLFDYNLRLNVVAFGGRKIRKLFQRNFCWEKRGNGSGCGITSSYCKHIYSAVLATAKRWVCLCVCECVYVCVSICVLKVTFKRQAKSCLSWLSVCFYFSADPATFYSSTKNSQLTLSTFATFY